MSLSSLGWDSSFATHFDAASFAAAGLVPARVALEHKHAYELLADAGELHAVCTGRLLHDARTRAELPAVGDWVAVKPRPGECHADIHAVLPRRTKFSRTAPGEGGEQIVATNIDTVLLVTALDQNLNLRRIERYLTAARDSGAEPVVVLNKADLHRDAASARAEVAALAGDIGVVAVSAARGEGLESLAPWTQPGRTLAFLGSSGVGKSTLINRLLGGERQTTSAVSDAVGKGRHTTTARELIVAPGGFLVVDTPGMRELQFWDVNRHAVDATFRDVTERIMCCRFTDCSHEAEPGCAIRAALDSGELSVARWESFQKLQREQAYAARKADPKLARATRAHWRRINKQARSAARESPEE